MAAPVLNDVKPLFVATAAELWSRLRLTGVDDATAKDAAQIMRAAVIEARLTIYDRLGKITVDAIKATAESSAPETDAQLKRSRAGQLETRLVRRRLLQDLPVLFRDNSGESMDQWNEEALTREGPGMSGLQAALEALSADIENDFALLDSDDDTTPSGVKALSIGPDPSRCLPVPGGSVLRNPRTVWTPPPTDCGCG